jgi:hypothetical protein
MGGLMTVFVANTNVLEIIGLKSAVEGTFVNDATVSVVVKDANGTPVAGQTWPTSLAYVTASSGDYRCILEHDLALENRQKYTAEISVEAGVERIGFWAYPFTAQTRTK